MSAKNGRPTPGTLAAETAELREAIRDGHALLKDLRAATAEAHAMMSKLTREMVYRAVEEAVTAQVVAVGEKLTNSTTNAIAIGESRIARRFADMEKMLIGIGKTAPEALVHAIRTAIALHEPENAGAKRRLDALAELHASLPMVQAATGVEPPTVPRMDKPAGGTR